MPWRKRAFEPGTKYVFLENIFGHSWVLVYGEGGRPWYGTYAQPESHFTCSSPRDAPRVVPSTSLFELFLGILRGPGEGRGGAPGTVPLQKPRSHFTEGMFSGVAPANQTKERAKTKSS